MLLQRLRAALTTWPSARGWFECAVAFALLAALYLGVGFTTGFIHFAPRPAAEIAFIAATAFIAPAFFEELFFRGLLIPSQAEAPRAAGWVVASTMIFTAWHVLETIWLPGAATLFLRPDFLALAATLGATCATLRRRSGSLLPPVLVHWAIVVGWIGLFGGPSLAELR